MWAVESKSDTSGVKPSALRPWQPHSETHVNIPMSRSLAGTREHRKVQMVQQDRPLFGHGSRTAVMFLQHVAREATHATSRCLPSSFSSVRAGIQAFGHIRRTPPIFLRRVALQATHATNRFLHGLNAPISRVGEPEQWSHEPMPAVTRQSGRRLRLQCRCSRRTICRWTPHRTAGSRSGTRSRPT